MWVVMNEKIMADILTTHSPKHWRSISSLLSLCRLLLSTRLNNSSLYLIWFHISLFASSHKFLPEFNWNPRTKTKVLYYSLHFPIIILKSMCFNAFNYHMNEPYRSFNPPIHRGCVECTVMEHILRIFLSYYLKYLDKPIKRVVETD